MTLVEGLLGRAAWKSIASVTRRLESVILGPEEEQALCRLRREALERVVQELDQPDTNDVHFIGIVASFLKDSAVAREIVTAILECRTIPLNWLASAAEQHGLVTSQLHLTSGKTFEAILRDYSAHLDRLIRAEATKPGSLLFHLVALSYLERLVEPIRKANTGFPESIRHFSLFYTGSKSNPTPFGGRDAELALLDAWLSDELSKPYFVITGRAGVGKSALIVRWLLRQNLNTTTTRLVFVPISLRFQTHSEEVVFAALACQLAEVYKTDAPTSATPKHLREFCLALLRLPPPETKRVVIILDGLDEASDWIAGPNLLPQDPGHHLKALIATRPLLGDREGEDWLRRLFASPRRVATSLHISGLLVPDVQKILEDTHCFEANDPLAAELSYKLFRSTEGDPLLIGLWIEEIRDQIQRTGTFQTDTVSNSVPGLGGIFATWWEVQRSLWGKGVARIEKAGRSLLALLASAKGSLLRREILAILPAIFTDGLLLAESANSISRFVAGNGSDMGYSLCHPRITEFVKQEMLDESSIRSISSTILEFCQAEFSALIGGQLTPNQVSPYVVRNFASHLQESPEHCR